MALAYVNSRPFLWSNIIGATNIDQLRENIESVNITLSADILKEIEEAHKVNSNPAP
jgi:aryl-alcohol dehydrogenase-like predicted oxidoreductase